MTTGLASENVAALRKLSEVLGIPMGRLLDQALENFLLEIGSTEKRTTPPVDLEYLRQRLKDARASNSG